MHHVHGGLHAHELPGVTPTSAPASRGLRVSYLLVHISPAVLRADALFARAQPKGQSDPRGNGGDGSVYQEAHVVVDADQGLHFDTTVVQIVADNAVDRNV